ncbi:MAG: DUF6318 family protein [Nocardioidaceae bacterium]
MSIRRCVAATIAAAVVASGALAGCGDDEAEPADSGLPAESELTESASEISPSTDGPTPTDPTPSGPQEPPLPAAAKAPGKAGAKAFVAHYIELLNYAQHTGDGTSLLRYGPSCSLCRSQARFATTTYRRGGWFRGGDWKPDPRTWLILPSGPGYFVAVNIDTAPGSELSKRGGKVTEFEADQLRINFLLKRGESTWLVRRIGTPS